jgi:hypothetical protein
LIYQKLDEATQATVKQARKVSPALHKNGDAASREVNLHPGQLIHWGIGTAQRPAQNSQHSFHLGCFKKSLDRILLVTRGHCMDQQQNEELDTA